MTLSLVDFNTPTVKNQEVSFLAILNFRYIYIYFINCLLTFATIIHKNPHLKTVNGGSTGINATCFSKGQKWKAGENTAVVCLAQFYRWSKTPLKLGVTFQTATTTEQQQKEAVASLNYTLFNLMIEEAIASLPLQQWISQIKRRLLEALKLNMTINVKTILKLTQWTQCVCFWHMVTLLPVSINKTLINTWSKITAEKEW